MRALARFLILISVVYTFKTSGRVVAIDKKIFDSIECTVFRINGRTISQKQTTPRYRCLTKDDLSLQMNNISENSIDFRSGITKLSVDRSDLSNGGFDVTAAEVLSFDYRSEDSPLTEGVNGTKTLAVIRVASEDGSEPDRSASELASDIFTDRLNVAKGFSRCSGEVVTIEPATGNNLVNGIMEVVLTQNVTDVSAGSVELLVTEYLELNDFDRRQYSNVMYVLPGSVNFYGEASYSYVGWYLSVFKNEYASLHAQQMQEIGHNFDQGQSGEEDAPYGDSTCMMGSQIWSDDGPNVCFNGAKSWWFKWYKDRHYTLNMNQDTFRGDLISINDYVNGQGLPGQKTIIRIIGRYEDDLYIMYNRKEGINSDVRAHGDEVTIVSQAGKADSQSWLLAGLDEGVKWKSVDWNRSGYNLVVKVCEKVQGNPDYASIIIYLQDKRELECLKPPSTPAPQRPPSPSPPTTRPPSPSPPTDGGTRFRATGNSDPSYCLQASGLNNGKKLIIRPCNSNVKQVFNIDIYGKIHAWKNLRKCLKRKNNTIVIGECGSKDQNKYALWAYNNFDGSILTRTDANMVVSVREGKLKDRQRVRLNKRRYDRGHQTWVMETV